MSPDVQALLAQAHFFADLKQDNRLCLAEVCRPREVRKRSMLFVEGEEAEAMFLLARGQVQLHKIAPDGTEVVIKVVRPGEVFAEAVLFEQNRYPVTALALTDVLVYAMPRSAVRGLLDRDGFRNDFIASILRRLRYLADRVLYLTACDVEERLLRFLDEQYGRAAVVQVAVSKRDIARAIGATPETLSRVINRLEGEGILRWTGRRLERKGIGSPSAGLRAGRQSGVGKQESGAGNRASAGRRTKARVRRS